MKSISVPFNSPIHPAWTSDSSGIIFNDDQQGTQLYIFDLKTGETKPLTDTPLPGTNTHPRWFEPKPHAVTPKGKLPTVWADIKMK